MLPDEERRERLIQHLVWMAERDPDYAAHAADWYESLPNSGNQGIRAEARQRMLQMKQQRKQEMNHERRNREVIP